MQDEAAFERSAMLDAFALEERQSWSLDVRHLVFGSDWSSSLNLGLPGDAQLG